MQEKNPELEYAFYAQEEQDEPVSNKKIFEKLEAIENKLDLIFGKSVLIKGVFQDIS